MDLSNLDNVPINPTFLSVILLLLLAGGIYVTVLVISFILERLSERFPARRLFFKRLQPIPKIVAYVIIGYSAIKIMSPEQSSLYAILGSMALALGLAAQDLLKDIIGGIVVLVDKPFQIGDRINVEGQYGEVTAVGLRSTKLVTPDDSLITVPNSTILSTKISNTNAGAIDCQVTVSIFLPVYLDLTTLENIAREAVLTSKEAYLSKPVIVDVRDEFREAHMTLLKVRAYVFDTRHEESFSTDLTRRIKKELVYRGLLPPDVKWNSEQFRKEMVSQFGNLIELNRTNLADSLTALGRTFADSPKKT